MYKMYKVVTVGGTFDHLHKGHRTILRRALAISDRVVVGVTSDAFRQKTRKHNLMAIPSSQESFGERRKGVEEFLRREGWQGRVEIVKIEDMFGPLKEIKRNKAKGKNRIEAMVVTRETRGNAEQINRWRRKHDLRELDIVEIEMVPAEDGEPISSKRIRAGEINREGIVYGMHRLWGRLPRELRKELRQPLGVVIASRSVPSKFSIPLKKARARLSKRPLITVGDISTKRLIEAGVKPDVAVFDLKVHRRRVFKKVGEIGVSRKIYEMVKLKNPAGEVTAQLYRFFSQFYNHVDSQLRKIKQSKSRGDYLQLSQLSIHVDAQLRNIGQGGDGEGFRKGQRREQAKVAVWIEGEEDLAALPAILFAPLGATVIYGQPPLLNSKLTGNTGNAATEPGLVVVAVTEEKKEYVRGVLQKFVK